MKKGIDVSENNGNVDWQAVKDADYEFAIVRCSYGQSGRDEKFLENVNGAHAVGLLVGAYHYGYGLTPNQAVNEASNCREAIESTGVLLDLPVFYDMEDADDYKANHDFDFSKENCTAICQSFISNIGLNCGIYASYAWLTNSIDWQSLECPVWNAEWSGQDDLQGYMWQDTSSAMIDGNRFDQDWLY